MVPEVSRGGPEVGFSGPVGSQMCENAVPVHKNKGSTGVSPGCFGRPLGCLGGALGPLGGALGDPIGTLFAICAAVGGLGDRFGNPIG